MLGICFFSVVFYVEYYYNISENQIFGLPAFSRAKSTIARDSRAKVNDRHG